MKILNSSLTYLTSFTATMSSLTLVMIVLLVALDVSLRRVYGGGVPSAITFTEIGLVVLVFLAIGKAQVEKQHIRMLLLRDKLPFKVRRYWDLIGYLAAITFFGFLFWESMDFFRVSYEVKECGTGLIGVPQWPARGIVVLGCATIIAQFFKDSIQLFTKK